MKLLGEETSEPAVVGDLAALKAQYEELKAAGEAKKTEIAEARKAAQAKAVAERTTIVEKAEASGGLPGRQHQLALHRRQVP